MIKEMEASSFGECANCGASHVALKVCSGCKLVSYCSKLCQKENWKKCHKDSCFKPQTPENLLNESSSTKANEELKNKKKIVSSKVKECANCGIHEKCMSMCSRCKLTSYCCQACQLQHWGAVGGHKKFCTPLDQRLPGAVVRSKSIEVEKCVICQEPLSVRASVNLPCSHMFHSNCVATLRKSDISQSCPVCRSSATKGTEVEKLFCDAHRRYVKLKYMVGPDKISRSFLTLEQGKEMIDICQLFHKAASLGHSQAQYYLGSIHELGHGVKQSDTEAFRWHEKAAQQGQAE